MGSFCKLLGLCSFSPFCLLYSVLSSLCAVSLVFIFGSLFVCHSFLWCRVLASLIAESSCCFQTCNRNSVCRLVGTVAYTLCRELMKSMGKSCDRKVDHTCYTSWSWNSRETVTAVHTASCVIHFELGVLFCVFLLPCSSVLVWSFSFTQRHFFFA